MIPRLKSPKSSPKASKGKDGRTLLNTDGSRIDKAANRPSKTAAEKGSADPRFKSTVWDSTGNAIVGTNPWKKSNGRSAEAEEEKRRKREDEVRKILGLRTEMETSKFKNNMGYLKKRQISWHGEFSKANDSSEVLDLCIKHGKNAQKRTLEKHRAEGFGTAVKPVAQTATQKGQPQKIANTHTKTVKTARALHNEIFSSISDAKEIKNYGLKLFNPLAVANRDNEPGSKTKPEGENIASVVDAATAAANFPDVQRSSLVPPKSGGKLRAATVYGGYSLAMHANRHHPLQEKIFAKTQDAFKNVEWRKKLVLEEHVQKHYINGYNATRGGKLWPSVGFQRHVQEDKRMSQFKNVD